jgi:predicted metalloprotease with PDZ domain
MNKRHSNRLALVLLAWVYLCPAGRAERAGDDSARKLRYTVSLAGYEAHLVDVRMELPPGDRLRQVQLPVWNALYQVRDFSQFVNWVKAIARTGEALAVEKIDKTTWQIDGASSGAIVEYEMVADEGGPYGAQLNARHAFFNLAEILMYPVEGRGWPTRMGFTNLPPGWRLATSLHPSGDGFQADNYDRLVDSPVEAGTFEEADFDEGGGHYRIVVDAEPTDYDMGKTVADVRKIVAAATSWMNDRPFETYLFLYHFPRRQGGGGMEHAYGTAIELSAQTLRDDPLSLDDVTAHEFFHLWNVKRIRPQSLEPIDYARENYTRALWFSEGVTSTVEDIILLRAGLLDEPHYRLRLENQMAELEHRPAHKTQSAEESSLDAWLEKYPYYRLPDRSISYYNKGELLGVALDLALRQASRGKACMRELFQWMNQNFARPGRAFPDSAGVRLAAETVTQSDFSSFFQKYVAGVQDIPWDDFFRTVGLRAVQRSTSVGDVGFVAARNFDAPPTVIRLRPGGDAERAGLAIGDTLLEINGNLATLNFEAKLAGLRPGELIHVKLRNQRGEREIRWKVAAREEVVFAFEDVDNITTQQKANRAAWLRGESLPAGDGRP